MLGILFLSSCSVNPSIKTPDPSDAATKNTPGFRYYLPVDRIRIEASRKKTTKYRPNAELTSWEVAETKVEQTVDVNVHTVADPATTYPIDLSPGRWTDDELKVVLNGNGTLSSINADSTGRAGDVIKNVVQFASVLSGFAGGFGARKPTDWPTKSACYAIDELPEQVRDRYFVFEEAPVPKDSKWVFDPKTVSSRDTRMQLQHSSKACVAWQKVKTDVVRVGQRRKKVRELEDELASTVPAGQPTIRRQLAEAQTLLARAEAELRSREALYEAIKNNNLKVWKLTPDVEKASTIEWISPDRLPLTKLVLDKKGNSSSVSTELSTLELTESKKLLDETGFLITQAPVGTAVRMPQSKDDACATNFSDNKGRIFYRQVVPTVITTWEENKNGELSAKKYRIEELIAPAPVRCIEFTSSGFAVRKLAMTFDSKGRPKSMNRSSTSSAAGFTEALATAATTARDAYVESLAKLVEADTSKRKLELSDLETDLATLKKEKEILDADLALQGGEANRDLVLQQQTLDTQLKLLQAELALEQTKNAADVQQDIAQLKLQLEQLQQQIALLQAQNQLRDLQSGG